MSRLVALYPRPWRDRYEEELLLLISERTLTIADRFDLIRGAVDARLHPQVPASIEAAAPSPLPDGDMRVVRRLGFAAVIGAVLWPTAFAVMLMGPIAYDAQGAYRDGGAAFPIFYAAVALLVAGLLGHLIRLPADARLARASAIAAIPCLLLFGMGPWMWPFALVAFALLAILAVAAWRVGTWPLWASLTFVAAIGAVMAIGAAAAILGVGDRMTGGAYFVVAGMAVVPAWLVLGATLVRGPSRAGTSPTGVSPA